MDSKTIHPTRSLELRRIFSTSRERVFAAWTRPEVLQQWWGVAEGYTTPVAEVELRVGGQYRLGMLPPDGAELIMIVGEYQVIEPPERLEFTWGIEGQPPSLISLRFLDRGDSTELVLIHSYEGPEDMAEQFRLGWTGMFDRLERALSTQIKS